MMANICPFAFCRRENAKQFFDKMSLLQKPLAGDVPSFLSEYLFSVNSSMQTGDTKV
jgi:hypothetical protein